MPLCALVAVIVDNGSDAGAQGVGGYGLGAL
ncbi:Uncharacterised protein [Klebsiella pneumoniae]|uniref:Uncharacterized protein n=1 Tax=Klebsiella pneumoniae TaxID=573 RepID=A0A377XK26_KLEPN|nr:Uncharacterised protein [Klebsiella pneumoniae]